MTGRAGRDDQARRGVTTNSLLSMMGLIVLGATRVLYGSLISRGTDPETYGTVVVLIGLTMILSLLGPGGLGSAITRYVPFTRGLGQANTARVLYGRLSRLSLGAALLLGLGAGVGALQFGRPPSQVVELSLLTVLYSLYITHKAGLYAFDEVRRYVRLEVASAALTIAATVGVLLSGSNIYLLPLISGYGLFVLGSTVTLRRHASATRETHGTGWRGVLWYAGLACVGSLAGVGFLQGTQLLAADRASLTAAAYFGASITLIAPLHFLPRALSLALFPFMAEAHGSGQTEVVRRHADIATRALLVLLAPLFVAGLLLAPDVLVLYGGSAFRAGGPIFQVMLLAAYAAVVQVASVNALSTESGRDLRTSVIWAVAGALTGLGLIVLLGHTVNAMTVAVAYLAGTVLSAAGPITVVWHRYRMAWAGPVARSLLAVGSAFVAALLLAGVGEDWAASWMLNGAAAVAAVATTLLILRRDLADVLRAEGPSRGSAQGDGGTVPSAHRSEFVAPGTDGS